MRIGLIGTNNSHGHQVAGFINGWRRDVPIPTQVERGPLLEFYSWAKTLRELEAAGLVPLPGVRVTRLWSESPESEGALIAAACGIADIVDEPLEAAHDVDAVLLLTDDPHSHFEHAVSIIRASLPVFVDKPLTADAQAARALSKIAVSYGVPWFSGSAFRFSSSLKALKNRLPDEIGNPTGFYIHCPGSIDRYGIHALEILNVLAGHDVRHIAACAAPERSVVLLKLVDEVTAVIEVMNGPPFAPQGQVIAWGERGSIHWECPDVHRAIFRLVQAFVDMATTGSPPVSTNECLSLARLALDMTKVATDSLH